MKYKILYCLFIIICIVYPYKTVMGPITIRHLISLFMLGLCVYEGFNSDKYLKLYFVFLFFLGFSSLITGYIGLFFNKFLGTYIPMITAYMATYLLIKKYNGATILAWLFVGIGTLNALITIGQFLHLGIMDSVYSLLRIDMDEAFLDLSNRKELEGFAIPGLLDRVQNGYFLSATALLVLYNKKGNIIINLAFWAIAMVASVMAQERSGFYLAIAFSAFIIVKYFFSKSRSFGIIMTVLLVIAVVIVGSTYLDLLTSSDLRFAKGFETDGRSELRAGTWRYLSSNLFGGFYEFDDLGIRAPHNFFVNAFLYGGIFGGTALIIMTILQVIKTIPYFMKKSNSSNSEWAFIWGLMFIDLTINSMVHNASVASGSLIFFVFWGAFLGFTTLVGRAKKTPETKMVAPVSI